MADYTETTRLPCANVGQIGDSEGSPCLKPAPNVCKGCFLVQYCSRECQLAHWSLHKADCKSPLMKATWKPAWDMEKRRPEFVNATHDGPLMVKFGKQKYLWGNVPAIDVVHYLQNEGKDLPEQLNFLFAASGDIRNVVKSLTGLPKSFTGQCDVVINDRDIDIVARNAILLLTSLHFSPGEAVPTMLHLWYSAFIPEEMFRSLQDNILPLLQDVCAKIQEKPAESLQAKTWNYGERSLRLVLQKAMWDRLPSYLQVPEGLTLAQARNIMTSTTLAPERQDYVDRAFYTRLPPWRVCITKFRKDGILLPFGQSRKGFNTPNPTLYQTADFWPMMDSADPLQGWSVKEVTLKAPFAKDDIYGSLFIYIQDVLSKFCRQIERLNIRFQLFQVDALGLPCVIKQCGMDKHYFDRIEVSNISDRGYIGPKTTLSTFGPFLKRKTQNPHATLLTLFLNAVHETSNDNYDMDQLNSFKSEAGRLGKYLKVTPAMLQDKYNPDFVRYMEARIMFRDFDKIFKRFMDECRFEKIGKAAGLKMKPTNTIIEPWPLRLKENAKQEEFNLILASGHIGSERYVEWESVA